MDFDEVKPSKGDSVLNLNRSRQKARYWRQINTPEGLKWIQTEPLPADPQSIAYYFAKGFRGEKPGTEKVIYQNEQDDGVLRCPICKTEVKNPIGLRSHLRVHIKNTKGNGNE